MQQPPNERTVPPKRIIYEEPPEPNEIRVDKHGRRFRWTCTGYTFRQWFSRETPEKGPGPGWDARARLLDREWTLRRFGRIFTEEEVMHPELLPEEPYFQWTEVVREKEV